MSCSSSGQTCSGVAISHKLQSFNNGSSLGSPLAQFFYQIPTCSTAVFSRGCRWISSPAPRATPCPTFIMMSTGLFLSHLPHSCLTPCCVAFFTLSETPPPRYHPAVGPLELSGTSSVPRRAAPALSHRGHPAAHLPAPAPMTVVHPTQHRPHKNIMGAFTVDHSRVKGHKVQPINFICTLLSLFYQEHSNFDYIVCRSSSLGSCFTI